LSLNHYMVLTCFILRKVKETYEIFNQPTLCPRHAMTRANCYLHSFQRNLSVTVLRVRWKVVFPARSNQTSWKKPNTIYILTVICHFRGIPSFNSIMHSTINDSRSHATSHLPLSTSPLVLYLHFTRSHVIPMSETLERTLFGSDKREYTSREHKIPLRSIYCLLWRKNKTSNLNLHIFLKNRRENNWL